MKETMKRCLALLLAVAVVMSGLPMNAFASEAAPASDQHVHTDDCDHDDEAAAASEESDDEATADSEEEPDDEASKEEAKKEESSSKKTTSKESEPKTEEKTQVEKVQERIDDFVEEYGFSSDMSDKDIENKIYKMDSKTLKAAWDESVELKEIGDKMSESELEAVCENKNVEVVGKFYFTMEAMMTPQMAAAASGTHTPIEGITVGVSGATDNSMTNGAVTVTAKGSNGFFGIGASAKTATITVTNSSGKTATISFGWAASSVNKLVIDGETYTGNAGVFTKEFAAGTSITITVTTAKNSTENKLVLSSFLVAKEVSDVTFDYNSSLGSITVDGMPVEAGNTANELSAKGVELVAIPANGSTFLGWINEKDNTIISKDAKFTFKPAEDMVVKAAFSNINEDAYFRIKGQPQYLFSTLDDAVTKATSGNIIVLAADGVLPAGNYTIPSGVTLLVPFDDNDSCYIETPEKTAGDFSLPSAYRTLVMEKGANIKVKGNMSVSAKQFAANGGERGAGMPYQKYGYVKMAEDSLITVNPGGKLSVYGYISGAGEIIAEESSKIYESFQFEDFRGGDQTSQMGNRVFVFSQYYVQNIEVPLTLYAGATEYSYASMEVSLFPVGSSVAFISKSGAMFNLSEGYVKKYYDKKTDRLIIEADGNMTINPLSLSIRALLVNIDIDSKEYVLPINSNMTIDVKKGNIILNQDVAFLPGSKIIIGKDATCTLGKENSIYIYDAEQWGTYAFTGGADYKLLPVSYVPERVYTRKEADLVDAEINVEGIVDATAGYVYTTAGGANIKGNDGAVAKINPGTATITYQYKQKTTTYDEIDITPAKLKNADGTYLESNKGANTYTYTNGKWVCEKHDATAKCKEDVTCTVCGTVIPGVEHDWVDVNVINAATCTAKGSKNVKCQREGCEATEVQEIPMLDHVKGEVVKENNVDPTCTAKGSYDNVIYCTECKGEVSRTTVEVDTIPHTEEVVKGKAATCTETGLTEGKYCTVCKQTTVAQQTVDALGHKEETVPGKAATCTETGLTAGKKCTVCGETTVAQTEIKKKDHEIKETITDATCYSTGMKVYTCLNCDEYRETEEIPINPEAHEWTLYDREEPTCTTTGLNVFYCKHVDKCKVPNKEEVVPALEHIPGEEATCTTPQTCQRENCGEELVAKLGHDWVDVNVINAATCTAKGSKNVKCQREGCDETEVQEIPVLEHVEGEAVTEKNVAPTCTEKGSYDTVVYCTVGGEELSRESTVVDALGHKEVKLDALAPTCDNTGLTEGVKCSVCNEVLTEQTVVDALGHDYVGEVTKAPTCTEAGVETFTCRNDKSHTYTKVVDALDHTEGNPVEENRKDPTCSEEGSYDSVIYCTECKAELSRTNIPIPTIPHTEGTMVVENKVESTCTSKGSFDSVIYCTECRAELSRTTVEVAMKEHTPDHDATCTEPSTCTECTTVLVEAIGHDTKSEETTKATCTEAGVLTTTCSRCDYKETETVEALGHWMFIENVKKEATCTEPGTSGLSFCVRCQTFFDEVEVPALGHAWDDGVQTKKATCTEDGTIKYNCTRANCDATDTKVVEAFGHTEVTIEATDATCENPGNGEGKKCVTCDEVTVKPEEIPALGHTEEVIKGKAATCTEAGLTDGKKCTRCGNTTVAQTVIDPLEHTESAVVVENKVDATCTATGSYDNVVKCSVCGKEISRETVTTPVLGHTEEVLEGKDVTCTEDGLTDGKKCTVCGETTVPQKVIKSNGHSNGEVVVENKVDAKCEVEGSYDNVVYCVVCGEEQSRKTEIIEALHHKEEVLPAEDATCTATGLTEGKKCTVCGETTVPQEEIPMTDHVADEAVKEKEKAPNCVLPGKYDLVVKCKDCGKEISRETITVEALGHKEKTIEGKEPTCTEPGLTDGKYCPVCDTFTTKQNGIPAKGHSKADAVKENNIAPTCKAEGSYDSVVYCTVCDDELLRTTETVDKLPHTEEVLKAVDPTCTETGLTEGKKCSVCGDVLKAQEEVDALGHTEEVLKAVDPTCTETGLTEGKKCSVCGEVLKAQEEVDALDHTEEVLKAVDPTCTETGLTEGKKCSVCGETLEAQEEIPTLDHTWNRGTITVVPTCDGDGERTFTCTVCGGTKTEVEPMLGHDIEQVKGKKPTFTDNGFKDYERCLREDCGYTTYEVIPALGEQSVETFDEFLKNLEILENIADEYVKTKAPGKDPAALIIKYIRTGVDRYNSGSWQIMAGYEDADFAKFVKEYEAAYNAELEDVEELMTVTGIKNIEEFTLPNGDHADIGHVFGTMDITYTNNSNADVGGWAGDLVDLMSLADQFGVESTTVEELVKEINKKYYFKYREDFSEEVIEGTFSKTDVYGDLDAIYIMKALNSQEYEKGTLTKIFKNYMTSSLTDVQRAAYFLNNRLHGETLRSDVREAVYNAYLAEKAVTTLESTREFKTKDLTNLRKAVCYVFADYLCKLAGDWVDTTENDYLEVFQSTSSTLAPGITQKIHHATTADGKTMVYYTATADITRSDVNVYANYNNNDPGAGWQMSRVLDQANAAQEKYGNPESPKYIENYNVIASINADGFNMSTGEPGGLLVMDGKEWHACDGNGFFAILADGTARIGTLEDYKQLKAEGKVKEAVGAFGTSLVKDGKINITASGDYYSDRAGRTAVGITKSGKVVFLVIDGRQGEFSCGASAIEIAQVMLDAGCYQAVNLDGGGSSTYVAREAGADSLAVVSKPSDGAARSVSTSLMMVSTAPSSTVFDHAVLESDYAYVTEGAGAQFTASGVSATGNAVELPEGVKWEVADKSVGTISEEGAFTAKGLGTTEVQLTLDGNVVGSKKINVVIPDNVFFTRDTMNTICGQESVLPVKAAYQGKSVAILEKDVVLTLANETAGTLNGFTFVPDEASGLKKVTVTAQLAKNAEAATASMVLNIYTEDEAMFDFDKATGGDPQFAWKREVSNAVHQGNNLYNVIDREKDMDTSYTFAIDMSKIDIPPQLSELTYMLPGSDMENASAWNFLLQLAERVSVQTEVKATIDFDDNMDVDYSDMSVSNEYFIYDKEKGVEFNEETKTLTLKMKWKDQVGPIDPETANPLCIVTNIKLTPEDGANWNDKDQLNVVNAGEISYNIFLRANALFTFASKPENQAIFGLTPFESTYIDVNGQEAPERGASFGSVYKLFEDKYSLNKGVKDGWVIEEGGFAYYVDGEKLTGIQKIDNLYYDFGENGINMGQKPCHGKVTDLDGKEYYFDEGERVSGWIIIDETDVNYYNPETFVKEKLTAKENPSTCIIDGYCDYTSESGAEKRVPYDDAGGHEYVMQGGSNVCTECGHVRVEMNEADVKLSYYVTTYTGTERTPATTVVAKNGVTLTKPPADYPDYSSEYKNNVEVGTASVTMTAAKYGIYANLNTWRGNAAGAVTVNYEIRPDLPANVVTKVEGTKINVSWEAAKAPGVTYIVYATKDGETWTEAVKTTELSCQFDMADKYTSLKVGTRKVVDGKTYDSIETTEEIGFELNVLPDNREDGKPTLKWTAMSGAVSYEVYRSTSVNGTYQKVFTTTGTTYTHVSATPGKEYYYKLKVIYEDGTTETSEILVNEYLKPVEDFVFKFGHRADGKPTLKWNPLIGATSYEVYRSDSKSGSFIKTFVTKGVTYTNTAAQPGGTYYYYVIAYFSDETTKTSEIVSNNCLILNKNISVSASNDTNGKVVVTWNAAAGAESYEVYVASSKSGTYSKKAATTGTSYTYTSGKGGKTYYFKVKVTFVDKTTKTSSIVSKKCLFTAKPKVTVTNRADGKNVLKWKALEGKKSYTVYYATSKNGKYKKLKTTTSTKYTHTKAKAGKKYYYKVKVTYTDKTTKTGDVVSLKCQKPGTKIKVKASNASSGKPILKWNAIKNGSKFTIYRATSKKGKYEKVSSTTGLSYTDKNAKAGKKYYYKVKVTYTNKKTKTSSIVAKTCKKK